MLLMAVLLDVVQNGEKRVGVCLLYTVPKMEAGLVLASLRAMAFRLKLSGNTPVVGAEWGEAGWRVSAVHCAQDGRRPHHCSGGVGCR